MEWEIINGMAVSARDVKLGIDSRQAEKTALLQHFRMGCTGQLFDSFFQIRIVRTFMPSSFWYVISLAIPYTSRIPMFRPASSNCITL